MITFDFKLANYDGFEIQTPVGKVRRGHSLLYFYTF